MFETELTCKSSQVSSVFKLESDSYRHIKRTSSKAGWKFIRVDTVNKIGFPDILLLKKEEYWLIEVKRLKRKKLISIADNLEFQFGQLAFMQRAFTLKLKYLLCVVKDNSIAIIGDKENVNSREAKEAFGL